jgi:hypothetical protein
MLCYCLIIRRSMHCIGVGPAQRIDQSIERDGWIDHVERERDLTLLTAYVCICRARQERFGRKPNPQLLSLARFLLCVDGTGCKQKAWLWWHGGVHHHSRGMQLSLFRGAPIHYS